MEVDKEEGYEWISDAQKIWVERKDNSANGCNEAKPESFQRTTLSDYPGANVKVKASDE